MLQIQMGRKTKPVKEEVKMTIKSQDFLTKRERNKHKKRSSFIPASRTTYQVPFILHTLIQFIYECV